MRFFKHESRQIVFAHMIALGMTSVLCLESRTVVAADAPTSGKAEQKVPVEQRTDTGRGKFVSFKDGVLTLKGNNGSLLVWSKLAENTETVLYDPDASMFKPATLAALNQAELGTWIQVLVYTKNGIRMTIRIGERKGVTTGTFVSFKDNRLLILGTNLGTSFTKKYGNSVHFNRFPNGVPVFESVDGGEYQPIGPAEKVLPSVKEGSLLTVHAQGDDNITLIQIGTPKPAAGR